MKHNLEYNSEAAFEDELYNSLKLYGYLFPETVSEVEMFEKLDNGEILEAPLLQDILSSDAETLHSDNIDLEIGLAAYSSPDDEFPKLPDDSSNVDSENNDEP